MRNNGNTRAHEERRPRHKGDEAATVTPATGDSFAVPLIPSQTRIDSGAVPNIQGYVADRTVFRVRQASWTKPAAGDRITFRGETFVVRAWRVEPEDTRRQWWLIDCEPG